MNMSNYFLDDIIPRDNEEARRWIQTTCREEWGPLRPDPNRIQYNLDAFVTCMEDKKFTDEDVFLLVFKKAPLLGFLFSDFATWFRKYKNPHLPENYVDDLKASFERKWPLPLFSSKGNTRSSLTSSQPSESACNSTKRPCKRDSDISDILDLWKDMEAKNIKPIDLQNHFEAAAQHVTPSGVQGSPNRLTDNQRTISQVLPVQQIAKPKPLMVAGITSEKLRAFAAQIDSISTEDKVEYTVQMAGNMVKLQPDGHWDKFQIVQTLEKLGIEFYTVPDLEPTIRVVIGKLVANPDDIKEFLDQQGFETIKVTQLTSRRDSKPLPLYLVTLKKTAKSADIFKLNSMFRIRIRVEKFRPPRKAIQCYRCNGFWHTAANCKFKPKCAICAAPHETRDCPRKNIPRENRPPPLCCNCNEQHAASYKGCKKFPERKSYAQAAKGDKRPGPALKPVQTKRNVPAPVIDTAAYTKVITDIKKELEIDNLTDLLKALQGTLEKIRNLPDVLSKRLAFLEDMSNLHPVLPGASDR